MFKRKKWRKAIYYTGILLLMAGCLFFLFCSWKGGDGKKSGGGDKDTWIFDSFLLLHSPLTVYCGQERGQEAAAVLRYGIHCHTPLLSYASQQQIQLVTIQDSEIEQLLLLEGTDESQQSLRAEQEAVTADEQEITDAQEPAKDSQLLQQENEEEIAKRMLEENKNTQPKEEETEPAFAQGGIEGLPLTQPSPVKNLDRQAFGDFGTFLQSFYVVDETTYIGSDELNMEDMLNQDLTIDKTAEDPQILIYHTHSQEGYADSIAGDSSTTVVGAGEKLTQLLTEQYGFSVLHDTGEYDKENRDYAYAKATPALEKILAENPSIQVIIDLHRDGVDDATHLVTEFNGRKCAQFMFFNGLSRTRKTGEIDYLYNENRAGNLAFSLQLQTKAMEYYPDMSRKIYLKGYRYNMQYRKRSLLIELGAQTNTLEEVHNALPPLAHVIAMVLGGE